MKKVAAYTTSGLGSAKAPLNAGSVGLVLLDTTWRMATPVLLFAGLGIIVDRRLGSKPWMTLVGVIIGFAIAAWLVKKQLDAVERQEDKE